MMCVMNLPATHLILMLAQFWADAVTAINFDMFLLAGTLLKHQAHGDETKDAPLFCAVRRCSTNPFYRQLYRGLKEIDTLKVADEVTASIMY